MRVYYCNADSDKAAPATRPVSPETLSALGLELWSRDVDDYQFMLRQAATERGFPANAVLEIFDFTLAGCHGNQTEYERTRRRFGERFAHPEDVVACVVSGEILIDFEDPLAKDASNVIRTFLTPGDLLAVPAGTIQQVFPDGNNKMAFIMNGEPGLKEIRGKQLENHPVRKNLLSNIGLE
ncbi:1,2-dihydroxy-3-keto-5-methylthiopentene dioxygenase [Paramarasmius palmivorus]|uniref:1,2-dihydroxy-3-keto-5-methylthiopentene dioxygenase n=1 Tax=Paramarasmius palmivorus TaxID=297713 RepID=A0AAW0D4S9_9AGAR